ncbi:hypothetical protein [Azotobacter beijerinckii]|uniref:hypothetical protein n=1 Tax=Azotobacter beijerinckii TaxID=170623 RepID=UPI002955AFE2|nr:hypothetical protein [Azotobacter beijerinckii]MDV7209883.1 hypothetical protein [Azotobacter beijerinckii]
MFGLRVTNDSGVVQVSSEKPYMSLHAEGYQAIGSTYRTTITFAQPCTTTQPPIIFIRAERGSQSEQTSFKCGVTGSPGNWTGFVLINGNTTQVNYLYWFAAVWRPLTASGNYGMRIRDANGEICFHASSQLIKFSRVITEWTEIYNDGFVATFGSGIIIASDEYMMASHCHTSMVSCYGGIQHIGVTLDADGQVMITFTGHVTNSGVGYLPVLLTKKS